MSRVAPQVWPAALRLDQAAEYCGLDVSTFLRVCPVQAMPLADGRWLQFRLQEWMQWLPEDWSPEEDQNDFNRIHVTGSGWIYVVGFGPYVKIGFTTRSVEDRIVSLQTGCPETISVYAAFRGPAQIERHLHQKFSSLRTQGEWFRREGELASWIEGGCK